MDERKLRAEVVEHLAQGRKIMAVKRVREVNGWSLARAKGFVDEIEAHGEQAVMPASTDDVAQEPRVVGDPNRLPFSSMPADPQQLAALLEPMLRDGRMIEAIKIHRQATGMRLAESKAAIEAMRDRLTARSAPPVDAIAPTRRRFADEDSKSSAGPSVGLVVFALFGLIATGAALAFLLLGR